MRQGVVWALSHTGWLEELLVSAKSCAEVMPEAERLLYSTSPIIEALGTDRFSLFDAVIALDGPGHAHRPRFEAMLDCPLDRALFVDTDTYFAAPVWELLETLDQYDLAGTVAPHHIHPRALALDLAALFPPVSQAIPEINTGVLACRVTDGMRDLVRRWQAHFATCVAAGYTMDQFAFRVALAESPLRLAPVPSTYNFRAHIPQMVTGAVKILHAHGDLARVAGIVNATQETRLYQPDPALMHGMTPKRRDG